MTDSTARAAALLLEARATGKPLAALPPDCRPRDAAAAYAVQDRVLASLGPIAGWKVGAAGLDAEPNCAPLAARFLVRSPYAVPAGSIRLNGIEAELAFTLGRDLPPRAAPYTAGDVAAVLGAVHAAIELVDSRFESLDAVDTWSKLADFQSHGALVVGPGLAVTKRIDATQQHAVVRFGDTVVAETTGGNAARDVYRLLAWLANHAAARCGGLKAGQVVTTGSCTGLQFAPPGTRVAAALDGLGEVVADLP